MPGPGSVHGATQGIGHCPESGFISGRGPFRLRNSCRIVPPACRDPVSWRCPPAITRRTSRCSRNARPGKDEGGETGMLDGIGKVLRLQAGHLVIAGMEPLPSGT